MFTYDPNHLLINNYDKLNLFTKPTIQNYEEALDLIEEIKSIILNLDEI